VAPVDQTLLLAEDVNVVVCPTQIDVDGLAVITGVGGVGVTVTVIGVLVAEQPLAFV
jgi:hypothetical protein